MGGSTVAADAVRIISPLLETHHAEHVLYEVRGSTQTSKYQPCMHSHAVSSFTPDARFRTSCAGLEIKAPEFRAQAKRKASIYKDVSSRRQEPVDKSAERKSSQAQIRGLSGRVECDNTPSYFLYPATEQKAVTTNAFFQEKLKKRKLLWCCGVSSRTLLLPRTVSNEAGTILCALQAWVGMILEMQTRS